MQDKIQIFDSEPDKLSLYSLADIVISASDRPEACRQGIIEAQAMGKIVIASDVGSTREIIQHRTTGLCFETNNAQDLADNVEYALNLAATEAAIMKQEARHAMLSAYSLEQMIDKTLAVYAELNN